MTLVAIPIERKCLFCHKVFLTYDSDKLFCGPNCKYGREYSTDNKPKIKDPKFCKKLISCLSCRLYKVRCEGKEIKKLAGTVKGSTRLTPVIRNW